MALQTSGLIRLGDIHVEAEGSIYAGTSISSLNDANIRGLTPAAGKTINATLGTMVSFSDFYGASATTVSQFSYTGGQSSTKAGDRYGYASSGLGSNLVGSPTSSDGWGLSMTVVHADNLANTSYYRFYATCSGTPNSTWWDKCTVSVSGYADLILERSTASITVTSTSFSCTWPNEGTRSMIGSGATVTWTFSS